ncbi:MAG: hypothetical protein ACE5GZ_10635 [Gammaproteobacteria bacterium]
MIETGKWLLSGVTAPVTLPAASTAADKATDHLPASAPAQSDDPWYLFIRDLIRVSASPSMMVTRFAYGSSLYLL